MINYIPNIISISRFILGILLFLSIQNYDYYFACILILCAAISDFLDGFFARYFSCQTKFGRCLDPAADKFFFFCLFTSFLLNKLILPEIYVLFILRDLMLVLGWFFIRAFFGNIKFQTSIISKINTLLQFAYALAVLFNQIIGYLENFQNLILYIVVLTTVSSSIGYLTELKKPLQINN